ncbi:MAG: hypothetical protein LBR74_04110 [Eubacterium sp.]|jgi:hypothetical protein|nr:hypothetical protein [Eubacterium sp.]
MAIDPIGALGGLMAFNSVSAVKPNRIEKPVTEDASRLNIADRERVVYGAPEGKKFDRVDFSFEEIRSGQATDRNLQGSLQERIEAAEEKPDFKAIKLIKESEIPMPDPPDFAEIARETRENLQRTRLEERLAAGILGLRDSVGYAARISENVASAAAEGIDRTVVQPDAAVREAVGMDSGNVIERFANYSSEALEKIGEQNRESATVSSSDELQERYEPIKLTPAQNKGIEVYQRFMNYADPNNLSLARTAV